MASGQKRVSLRQAKGAIPHTRALGRRFSPFQDLYHVILTRSWTEFFLLLSFVFLSVNALFAVVYAAQPGSIVGARTGSLEDAFYFSVQTMATIGYGAMSPATRFAHIMVTLEAILGMLGVALVTGITFAKFARPTARVLFSEKICLATRDGVPHLLFRMANWRHNNIIEAQLRVLVLVRQQTREGESIRVPIELPLVRERTALFLLSWQAMHRIDEKSPFYGEGAIARLREQNADIILSLSGTDETFAASVHARYSYKPDDIVINARFRDVLTIYPDGSREIDYRHFHEVVPIEAPGTPAAPGTTGLLSTEGPGSA